MSSDPLLSLLDHARHSLMSLSPQARLTDVARLTIEATSSTDTLGVLGCLELGTSQENAVPDLAENPDPLLANATTATMGFSLDGKCQNMLSEYVCVSITHIFLICGHTRYTRYSGRQSYSYVTSESHDVAG